MAEIKPMALIESMKKKVCEHSDVYFRTNKQTGKVTTGKFCKPSTKILLGTHRVAATTSDACNRVYLRKKIKRSTLVSNEERAARNRFAAIVRAVNVRKKDMSLVPRT